MLESSTSKAAPSDYLSTLPVELLNEVLILCSLSDVLHLQQCCRSLYSHTLSRYFWIQWFTSFCAAMGMPSQALHLSSLTDQELQTYATRHLRFRQNVLRQTNYPMRHSTSRIIARNVDQLTCLALVPGGRHLLAAVAGHIQLWDLGVQSSFQPVLVLTTELPHPLDATANWGYFQYFQYENGKCKFVLTMKNYETSFSRRCYIYTLSFDPEPDLTLVGSKELAINGELAVGHIGNKFVFKRVAQNFSSWTLLIHDFPSKVTLAIPNMEGDYLSARCTPMFDGPSEALFMNVFSGSMSKVVRFPLPDASVFKIEASQTASEIVLDLQPSPIFAHNAEICHWDGDSRDFVADRAPLELNTAGPRATLSNETAILDKEGSRVTFTKHLLAFNSDTGQWQTQRVHQLSCRTEEFPLMEEEIPSSLTFPNGDRFIWFVEDTTCQLAYLVCSNWEREQYTAHILFDISSLDGFKSEANLVWDKHAFTPFLGRFAVYHPGAKELEVYDYDENVDMFPLESLGPQVPPPPDYFSSLPTELLNEIMISCSLSDIIRLRQCCHSLHSHTLSRYFWDQFLTNFCAQMGMPVEALHLSSLTDRELEAYATRHLRFRKKVLHETGSAMCHSTSRIIAKDMDQFTCHALVPGGRHLLVVVAGHIQLWDLGVQRSFQPALVLTSELPHPLDSMADWGCFQYFQFEAGKCRFLLTMTSYPTSLFRRCYVYALGFDPKPDLVLVGSKEIDQVGEKPLGHMGDKLVFRRNTVEPRTWNLLVHDFSRKVTIMLPHIDGEYLSCRCTPMFNGTWSRLWVKVFSDSMCQIVHFTLPDFSSFISDPATEIVCDLQPTVIWEQRAEVNIWEGDTRDFLHDMMPLDLSGTGLVDTFSPETIVVNKGDDVVTFTKVFLTLHSDTGRWQTQQVHKFSCSTYELPLMEGEIPFSVTFPDGLGIIWFVEDLEGGSQRAYLVLVDWKREEKVECTSRVFFDMNLLGSSRREERLDWDNWEFTPFLGRMVVYHNCAMELEVYDYD